MTILCALADAGTQKYMPYVIFTGLFCVSDHISIQLVSVRPEYLPSGLVLKIYITKEMP